MTTRQNLPSIDDLTLHDPQTVADDCLIPVIWCDHQATRRQRLHGANIPGHHHAFSSTHLNECLEFLADHGFTDAILICETPRRRHLACYVTFAPLQSPSE